ncbi:MAG: hypothetical protein J0G32_02220 [Alphaproteobacteria bacterium]|nr:hypothetical protein [Alphaproteobacteria bacterium]
MSVNLSEYLTNLQIRMQQEIINLSLISEENNSWRGFSEAQPHENPSLKLN